MKRYLFVVLLLIAAPGQAGFFNYAAWAALSGPARALYIAGAWDAFEAAPGPTFQHFRACAQRANMTPEIMAENVYAYGKTRPELQTAPAMHALAFYFADTCGTPDKPK